MDGWDHRGNQINLLLDLLELGHLDLHLSDGDRVLLVVLDHLSFDPITGVLTELLASLQFVTRLLLILVQSLHTAGVGDADANLWAGVFDDLHGVAKGLGLTLQFGQVSFLL